MLYEALSGQLPFQGATQAALFRSIQRGTYEPLPQMLSSEVHDLVKRLLTVDPAARITWEELSRHPWLSSASPRTELSWSSTAGGRSSGVTNQGRAGRSPAASGRCSGDGSGCSFASGAGACKHDMRLPSNGDHHSSSCSGLSSSSMHDTDVGLLYMGDRAEGTDLASPDGGAHHGLDAETSYRDLQCQIRSMRVCSTVAPPQQAAVSFTSKGCHESVRVVIQDSSGGEGKAAYNRHLLTCCSRGGAAVWRMM